MLWKRKVWSPHLPIIVEIAKEEVGLADVLKKLADFSFRSDYGTDRNVPGYDLVVFTPKGRNEVHFDCFFGSSDEVRVILMAIEYEKQYRDILSRWEIGRIAVVRACGVSLWDTQIALKTGHRLEDILAAALLSKECGVSFSETMKLI